MFLSLIKVNVGVDPNRPRPGREWLKNPYRVHQRLSMAFGEFAKDERGNHVSRDPATPNFLYRIEGGNAVASNGQFLPARIIVLSTEKPDWSKAFARALHFLEEWPEEPSPFSLSMQVGTKLRFRLRTTPVVRKKEFGKERERKNGKPPIRTGKRIALYDEADQVMWLKSKENSCGFQSNDCRISDSTWVTAWKGKEESQDGHHRLTFHSVLFEGELMVSDIKKFRRTLAAGIGPGKAFGFGLLSVARA